MRLIGPEHTPSWNALFPAGRRPAAETDPLGGRTLHYLGSGKAAIAMVLDYLRTTGELPDKMAEVVVPAWIGHPVHQQVNAFGFPTLAAGPNAKVLLAYHQYGFPQDMDRLLDIAGSRRLVVIEDCAHACDGSYKGRPLGSLGRFAIYSFSKFAFCFALGGVSHAEPAFADFIRKRLAAAPRGLTCLINGFKLFDEWNFARPEPLVPRFLTLVRTMAYAVYGDARRPSPWAVSLWRTKRETELAARRRRYKHLRERTDSLGLCDHLEPDGVTPYAIPVRLDEARMPGLVETLRGAGFKSNIIRFDFNRCHLDTDFRKCVLLPCHGGMSDEAFGRLVELVRAGAA